MYYKDLMPSPAEVRIRREETGESMLECQKAILRERMIAILDREEANLSRWDLQQMILAILKGHV